MTDFKDIDLQDFKKKLILSPEGRKQALIKKIDKATKSVEEVKEGKQGLKGDKGDKGERGDLGHVGLKGAKGKDGRDGEDGKDGKNSILIKPKNGKDGKDGKDGKNANPKEIQNLREAINIESQARRVMPDFRKLAMGLRGDIDKNSDLIATGSTGSTGLWDRTGTNLYPHNIGDKVGIGLTEPNNTIQVLDLIEFDNSNESTFLGYQVGTSVTSGVNNTGVGYQALNSLTEGDFNIAFGDYALNQNTTGSSNSAMGYNALITNTTGYNNSVIGRNALYNNISGYENSAIGNFVLFNNITGHSNAAVGSYALNDNTSGYNNSTIGRASLYNNTTGHSNAVIGYAALSRNTTGYDNSVVGNFALLNNTTGYYNSAMGSYALNENTTGYKNLAMGYNALYNAKPTSGPITSFSDYGGTVAGTIRATDVDHGLDVGTTDNVEISGTTNYNGTYIVTRIDNNSFYFTDTWVVDDGTGWWGITTEGRYNIGIGFQAGDNITTGSNNLIIGYDVDPPSATADNQLNIGNAIYGDLSSGNIGIGVENPDTKLDINGALTIRELSTDPSDPDEGSYVTWMSDGTGTGDDGDIIIKITAGGSTKTTTLVDFSAI